MKRLILSLALLAVCAATASASTVFSGRPEFDPVKWRNPIEWSADSVMANVAAARCTSVAYPTAQIAAQPVGFIAGITQGVARVWFYTQSTITHTELDTIYYGVEGSFDKTTWYVLTNTGTALPMGASGDNVISVWLNTVGASGSTPGGQTAGVTAFPFIRFIVSAGNNSGGMPQAQILVAHESTEPINTADDIPFGKWTVRPWKWVSNSIDSTSISIAQATGTWAPKTTKAYPGGYTDMFGPMANSGVNSSAYLIVDQNFASAPSNCDSIQFAVETSVDGTNFTTNSSFTAQLSPVAGSDAVSSTHYIHRIPVSAVANATSTSVRLAPFWRLKIRGDSGDGIVSTCTLNIWDRQISR